MKVFIENDPLYNAELKYIFRVFAENVGLEFSFAIDKLNSDISIGDKLDNHILVEKSFYIKLAESKFSHQYHFESTPTINFSNGSIDFFSTAFYMLSCLQEFNSTDLDKFGRFKFSNSYQKKYGVINENLVQDCFNKILGLYPYFKNINNKIKQSAIFLSHDIDTVHGSIVQDGFYSFKKGRIDWMLKIFVKFILDKPAWLNIDRIMKIENEYEFRSVFYWLVNKGKVDSSMSNSDYDINSTKIREAIDDVERRGWENGLHKSASKTSFNDELEKLNLNIIGNRYHYLKFKPHFDFDKIQEAGLKFDSSLLYADTFGFRNNYGRPYRPYNHVKKIAYDFLECPLNIMDTTFFNYLKLSPDDLYENIVQFSEKHKYGNVISVLFHNNYISDYKYRDYLHIFKKTLSYFYESGFKSILQSELIEEYYHEN